MNKQTFLVPVYTHPSIGEYPVYGATMPVERVTVQGEGTFDMARVSGKYVEGTQSPISGASK